VIASACSLNVDYTGTLYRCGDGGTCPDGYTCLDGFCVPTGPQGTRCSTFVEAGEQHACAIRDDGTVWCWGRNDDGQLGDGTATDRDLPVQVANITGATHVVGGAAHSCAIHSGGMVSCWGTNDFGQLGDNTTTDNRTPVVAQIAGATDIVAGFHHTCALVGTQMQCWGANGAGQLGLGDNMDRLVPTAILGLGEVTSIAAGNHATCAVAGGAVQCWGEGGEGQLGDGAMASSNVPVAPMGIGGMAASVSGGEDSMCARTTAGEVWCWGQGSENGELGTGAFAASPTPVRALVPATSTSLYSGGDHSCALDDAERLWCWGDNDDGELYDGSFDDRSIPIQTGYRDVVQVAATSHMMCVRIDTGEIKCSGINFRGQLGDGTRTTRPRPQPVDDLDGVADLGAGGAFTCAVKTAGRSLTCWGQNDNGEVGDGTRFDRTRPVDIGLADVVDIDGGNDHACAAVMDGRVFCWGYAANGRIGNVGGTSIAIPRAVDGAPPGVVQVSTGGGHTCVATSAGAAWCWGYGNSGQLGDGQDSNGHSNGTPAMVMGLPPGTVEAVATGNNHSCAIAGGAVYCWGANGSGQLGNGTSTPSSTAVMIPTLSGIVEIDSAGDFTCARNGGGGVNCWGYGDEGQLGNDSSNGSSTPVVAIASGATALAMGGSHACALVGSAVWCWGFGANGAVGDDSYTDRAAPVMIAQDAIAIASGGAHTCIVMTGGGVECWGGDWSGQLGDGVRALGIPTGVQVPCD
jgi:alpha-tubulin suppressor-like RCC1 family protein